MSSLAVRRTARRLVRLPKPVLDLDFRYQGGFPRGLLDYTRTSAKTICRAGDGRLVTLANGVFHTDHDPVTGVPRGLPIEEGRSNLFSYSEEFDRDATWGTGRPPTITANDAVAPDGQITADRVTETATLTNQVFINDVANGLGALADDTDYVYSIHLKYNGRQWVELTFRDKAGAVSRTWFDVQNGVVGSGSNHGIEDAGNGWYRCWRVVNSASGATAPFVEADLRSANGNSSTYTGDGTSGVWVWGAQFEKGNVPTGYVRTAAASASRAADRASANVAAIVDASEMFVVAHCRMRGMAPGTERTLWQIHAGGETDYHQLRLTTTEKWQGVSFAGGVQRANPFNPAVESAYDRKRFALGYLWSAAGCELYQDGALIATVVPSGALPAGLATLEVASRSNGTDIGNLWVERLALYGPGTTADERRRLAT